MKTESLTSLVTSTTINVSCYKFVMLQDRSTLRDLLLQRCCDLSLKGTILLAEEGINIFLAGTREAINAFFVQLWQDARFTDIEPKESLTDYAPFKKMRVRLKKEIITMKHPLIKPEQHRAPSLPAKTLKKWLDQGHDDNGKPIVLLDTRNDYEIAEGSFINARTYPIKTFSEFPQVIEQDKETLQDQTVVSFCTGGIRCEKAALLMREMGITNTYQLEGGILKYFEEVGGDHWQGSCFVFDERIALTPNLLPMSSN